MAARPDDRIYVITHVDIMPKHTEEGAELLRHFGPQSGHPLFADPTQERDRQIGLGRAP